MRNPDQLPASPVHQETSRSENIGSAFTPQEQAHYDAAWQELAKLGWLRQAGESHGAFAQRTLEYVDRQKTSPEAKILNIAVPEYSVFVKLREAFRMEKARAEGFKEAKAALEALKSVRQDFIADGRMTEDQLKGSPQEQARTLLREYGYMGGEIPGSENAGLVGAAELKLLRALENGRINSYIAELGQRNEGLTQSA